VGLIRVAAALHPLGNNGERGSLVEFRFTASGKPALVHIGERFRELIVPVRTAG
jgi:hypothetical protein